jgi:hypothetical protein
MSTDTTAAQRNHIALHLAHRWFAFLEAPGGDMDTHLKMFHPQVRLSGHRGSHLFAKDHPSLLAWFKSIPDEISSHHIVHSAYSDAENGEGLLSMVVAYQAPSASGVHGSIISYETRIEFAPGAPRFIALDKTPILPNTKSGYETSWSANRVLARVHADLGGLNGTDERLISMLGHDVRQVSTLVSAPEGSRSYEAIVTAVKRAPLGPSAVRLTIVDEVAPFLPTIEAMKIIATVNG